MFDPDSWLEHPFGGGGVCRITSSGAGLRASACASPFIPPRFPRGSAAKACTALSANGNPSFATVLKVAHALGVKLRAAAA
jgi:hypothetical protein